MASNDTSWFPLRGRYHVEVAASVTRALKARKEKGENPPPAAKRSKIPVRDFHSLRYNFHPPSLDQDGVGSITVRTGKDVTSVAVERPSNQPGEGSLFTGAEHAAKEWECVLIFDEVNKKFFLEKLDSHMALTFERKVTLPVERPPPRAAPPAESSNKRSQDLSHEAEELEKQYLGADEDAVGEVDEEFEEILPQSIAQRQEEEEEEEEIHIPPPPRPLPLKAKPKPARSTKPSAPPPVPTPSPSIPGSKARQAPKPTAQLPPKPKPAPPQRGKKQKREPEPSASSQQPLSDAEELEFGKPARKRARPSPPPSEGLALPGGSTSVYNPLPPVPRPSSAQRRASPPPPPPTAPLSESEEEEDEWDEVAAVGEANIDDAEDNFDIFGDAAAASANGVPQDMEMDAFERELNLQMEESDEDFLADAVDPVEEEPARGVPISLTQLAAGANGGVGYGSEDEYSSSDDSDDE